MDRVEYLAEKLRAFDEWADRVKPEDLKVSGHSREIAKLVENNSAVDDMIEEARRAALRERGSA